MDNRLTGLKDDWLTAVSVEMKKIVNIILISLAFVFSLSAQSPSAMTEDWESGDFSSMQWERSGNQYRWEITSEGAHSGRYCARSGNYYTKNTESVLQLSVYLNESGTFSYFRKIFSAESSGTFYFYIDGVQKETLSGYADWSEYQCEITSGFHVLKFCYQRNGNASKGSDCVWIDDISLPNGIQMNTSADLCDAPAQLHAETAGNNVVLTWNGSQNPHEILIFDDVEGHEHGAINSQVTVGWSYIDGDNLPTGTFSSMNFLNEGDTMAFIVIDDQQISGTGGNYYLANSGHNYFGCPFHSNIRNDDWIISPELNFSEAFTFSFYARNFSRNYNEKFVASYSITDANESSFIPLHCDTIETTYLWTEYSFYVPSSAKYVALHCVSYDQYMLCLDDISIRGQIGHTCNVYRDGVLIATNVADSTYTDIGVASGSHCYTITYNCGGNTESAHSNEVCIEATNLSKAEITAIIDSIATTTRETLENQDHPTREVSNAHMATTLEDMFEWNKYPTYDVYTQLLQYFKETFPNLCEIDTILEDTPHPDLHHSIFAIHISNTLGQATTKPAFLYSSSMHGTEVVCFYMMLHLADYILNNATTDSAVMKILDNVDLYICPLENPDGAYHATNDLIWQGENYSTYHNYNDVQLNRNYPHLPGFDTEANIQPETQAIIDWVTPIHFVMSVNFHCGAELINYPWDSWTTSQRAHADSDWFRYIGQNYATLCHAQDTSYMYGNGAGYAVIDGGDWSVVTGSRQDYMTYYQHCREVTMEISRTHVVTDPDELQSYWNNSKNALLSYAMECDYGFWGVVTDAITHEPVEAMIKVLNHDYFHSEVYSHQPLGAYHRPIMAGTYTVEVSAPCYQTVTFTVTTKPGTKVRRDVELQPLVVAPLAFDQHILSGMQATVVALSQNEVFWFDSDTASEAIATGNYYTTPVLFDTETYYIEERFVEDTLVCISPRSSVSVFVHDTTGNTTFIENIDSQNFVVYPNPTRDYLTIESNGVEIADIAVYDTNGRLIFRKEQPTERIDVSGLIQGAYYLRMETTDGYTTILKFVKLDN
ncbi:MAG: T9SS type A sorting domain-containing protein [Bacteroidales bacterium]|nr:T9SS type A sorting domain-containing protein [Bacteroidales bacterium]